MSLGKRKRCTSPPPSLPSPPSTTFLTTPPTSSPLSFTFNSSPPPTTSSAFLSSLHSARDRLRGEVSSRTQKRTRNRGSENSIYQNTLSLLFGASRSQKLANHGMELDLEPKCGDCAGGMAEEIDEEGPAGVQCGECGKTVCKRGGCCVERGMGRVCLGCALR